MINISFRTISLYDIAPLSNYEYNLYEWPQEWKLPTWITVENQKSVCGIVCSTDLCDFQNMLWLKMLIIKHLNYAFEGNKLCVELFLYMCTIDLQELY